MAESSITFKDKVILSWDFWVGLAVSAGCAFLVPDEDLRPALEELTTAGLAVATALVGVVIAALAVVVAFLDDEFLALMDEATRRERGGIEGQLFPFWFVSGLGIATVLLSLATITFGRAVSIEVERVLVSALAGLIVWTALGVLNLVGYIHHTGVNRALLIRLRREATRSQRGR